MLYTRGAPLERHSMGGKLKSSHSSGRKTVTVQSCNSLQVSHSWSPARVSELGDLFRKAAFYSDFLVSHSLAGKTGFTQVTSPISDGTNRLTAYTPPSAGTNGQLTPHQPALTDGQLTPLHQVVPTDRQLTPPTSAGTNRRTACPPISGGTNRRTV